MSLDLYKVWRKEKVRDYQRRMIGAGMTEVSFQIPISGTAQSGISMAATDFLNFGVGFYPDSGENISITPAFRSGFSIKPRAVRFDPKQALGYFGVANCPYFELNDDGLYVGAICHVGVANLDADESIAEFTGLVTLSFAGMASQAPLDSGNHYQYTGPKTVNSQFYEIPEGEEP